jgi:hypothetical protein
MASLLTVMPFLLLFGIIFGNEDKDGWERFWKFASTRHPCLNHARVTIINDQQKGSIEAMSEVVSIADLLFLPSWEEHSHKCQEG